jgi:hypothetical protein
MPMNVTVIEESNFQQWVECLQTFSISPFITPTWLETICSAHRIPAYFRFESEGKTIGGIAGLILEPSLKIIRRINRPLFFFSGPAVLQNDAHLISACVLNLIRYATHNGYTGVQLNSWDYPHPYELTAMKFYKEIREEYIIDLHGEFIQIQNKMRKSIREQTRTATRNGITFHESASPNILASLILLLDETKSIRGLKGYEDYSYYYIPYLDPPAMHRLFEIKMARIFYAQKLDKVICVLLTVVWNKRAYALLIGANAEAYALRGPAFLWFHTLRTLNSEGVESLNLGGVANDSGASALAFSKLSLGAEKHTCVGGTSAFLQGSLYNLLHQLYQRKLSINTFKNFLHR